MTGSTTPGQWLPARSNHLGYYVYMYTDYPSLIRGGHNFALIRAADTPIGAYNDRIDYLVALNQETVTLHLPHCPDCTVVANADQVKSLPRGQTVSVNAIIKEESAPPITGNSAMIGAFAKSAGISWEIVGEVSAGICQRQQMRTSGLPDGRMTRSRPPGTRDPGPAHSLLSGNGDRSWPCRRRPFAYISYPMTPSSTLLHFLAGKCRAARDNGHPPGERDRGDPDGTGGADSRGEDCGRDFRRRVLPDDRRALVCRYGGDPDRDRGLPENRPSTGLPTYTGQAELQFVLHAGQGEFPRLVVAPADAGEAYRWSAAAMHLAWKYQIPAFVLPDKTLSEGTYSVDYDTLVGLPVADPALWDGQAPYRRYHRYPVRHLPSRIPGQERCNRESEQLCAR